MLETLCSYGYRSYIRSVLIGCFASVILEARKQSRARLLHAELVVSGSWLDLGGRVPGRLLDLSTEPRWSIETYVPKVTRLYQERENASCQRL